MSVNLDRLADEFDLDINMNNEDEYITTEYSGPDDIDSILVDNINRANRLLDKLENSINNGSYSAAQIEAASQMVNSITSATTNILQRKFNDKTIELKIKTLRLKELELQRELSKNDNNRLGITNNNIILTNREDLLKLMKTGKVQGPAEQISQIEQIDSDESKN
jgi:hypothetical protein